MLIGQNVITERCGIYLSTLCSLRHRCAGIGHGNSGNIRAPAFAAALAQPAFDQGRQSRPVAWPGFKPSKTVL
jgi:hypothetical protein